MIMFIKVTLLTYKFIDRMLAGNKIVFIFFTSLNIRERTHTLLNFYINFTL